MCVHIYEHLCVCECRTLFEITILFDLRRTSSGGWGIMTFLETFDSRFFLYFMQGVAFGLGQHGAKLFYELIWQKYVTGGRYVSSVVVITPDSYTTISTYIHTNSEKASVTNDTLVFLFIKK